MNRIILIGNGFDLAHGLKTKYTDFIDDFWEQKSNIFQRQHITATIFTSKFQGKYFNGVYKDRDISISGAEYSPYFSLFDDPEKHGYEKFIYLFSQLPHRLEKKLKIENHFLEQITTNKSLHNWVDIEEEYYTALKKCLEGYNKDDIIKLNNEFSAIKTALENYLKTQTAPQTKKNQEIEHKIYWVSFHEITGKQPSQQGLNNLLYLNFNYTNTEKLYITSANKVIHIHGELDNPANPIIFGYGDELDVKYKQIEDKNDNTYLENIKSIKYAETRNYKEMLAFINSDEYQVFIMGHSCGISDRTLLNTLFEHENCLSIKVFYHKREDGTDNYSDIIRNISRNFTDKSLMRELIIPKTDSEPLS